MRKRPRHLNPLASNYRREEKGAWKVTVFCVITKGPVSRLQKPVSFPRTQSSHPPAHGLSPASVAQQPPGHPESGYQPWMTPVILCNCGQTVSRQETAKEYCALGVGVTVIFCESGRGNVSSWWEQKAGWGTMENVKDESWATLKMCEWMRRRKIEWYLTEKVSAPGVWLCV